MGVRLARCCVSLAVVALGWRAGGCGLYTSACGPGWVTRQEMYPRPRPAGFDYGYVATRETRWSHPWPEPTPTQGVVAAGQRVFFGRSLEGMFASTGQYLGWVEGVGLRWIDTDALRPATRTGVARNL